MKPLATFAALLLLTALSLTGCNGVSEAAYNGPGEKNLPAFSFVDLKGASRNSSEWQNKLLVVNFWATWCPPCRDEMPLFIETQEKYAAKGVQVIGIAIDNPQMVEEFSEVYGINFPVLLGDVDAMELAERMGNSFDSLPFTAIYDRDGNTRYVQAGMISEETLQQELLPLL
ncbi:MAG: TlpA disulfide reductase family protein [Sedimenticola sp.]